MPEVKVSRIVPKTVFKSTTTNNAALRTEFDAALVAAMDAIIAAPPTGYQDGSIQLSGQPQFIFDGTNYIYSQTFYYNTQIVAP